MDTTSTTSDPWGDFVYTPLPGGGIEILIDGPFGAESEIIEAVTLHSSCLLSKWGFSDGDLLSWLPSQYDNRAVLVRLVRERLLPVLDQKDITIMELVTNHNPIRVIFVGDVEVDDAGETVIALTPESVVIPCVEVLELARQWFSPASPP